MQAPSLPSQVETAAVQTPGGGIEPATSRLREQHCRSLLYMVAALWTGAAVMLAAAAAGAGALREVVAQVLVVVAAVLAVRHGTRTGDWGGALAIYVTYLLPVYAYEQMLVDKIGGLRRGGSGPWFCWPSSFRTRAPRVRRLPLPPA